jgi:hypothetical protein
MGVCLAQQMTPGRQVRPLQLLLVQHIAASALPTTVDVAVTVKHKLVET